MNTGNTPTGNPGAGRAETSSAPAPVTPTAGAGNTGRATPRGATNVPDADTAGAVASPNVNAELTEDDFKKDGDLRAATIKRIEENAPPRGAERSFNEVTGKTTVTTTVGGAAVTFVEDGDTRGRDKREGGMESLARASERAEESK